MSTILVVDDEPDLEILISRRFRRQIADGAMTLLFARDGVEALETIAASPAIDVVLADIKMPRMDGLTLVGKLQESDLALATIVVSAYGDMGNIRAAMNRGAFDFLTKPIDFIDLESTIAKALRHVAALREARSHSDELQRQREALLRAEKLASFGTMLAGVSHELNNPLSIVVINALLLQEDAEAAAPALARKAERIRTAAERCARIVRSFLAMARQQETRREAVAVAPLIEGALELLGDGLRNDGIEVLREVPAGLPPVLGDPDQLHQVLTNLVTNARHAMEASDPPRRLRLMARAIGGEIEIQVADSGPGIPADQRGRIFDPFFTTKSVGSGTGLGLSVSRGIADALGGSLELVPTEVGASFLLRLPCAGAVGPAARDAPALAAPASATPRTALIVDNEAELASSVRRVLETLGYRCQLAASGREAQRLLARHDYDVILCDLRMPELSGEELYGWLETNRSDLCRRIAFVTGDTMRQEADSFLARSRRPTLEKPFLPEDVRRLVATLADPSGPG